MSEQQQQKVSLRHMLEVRELAERYGWGYPSHVLPHMTRRIVEHCEKARIPTTGPKWRSAVASFVAGIAEHIRSADPQGAAVAELEAMLQTKQAPGLEGLLLEVERKDRELQRQRAETLEYQENAIRRLEDARRWRLRSIVWTFCMLAWVVLLSLNDFVFHWWG